MNKALLILLFGIAVPALADPHKNAPKVAPKPSAPSPLAANAERLEHGRFGEVVVYKPLGAPSGFVLFLSGDGGWNLGVIDMAQALVQQGAMVVGVNTPRFLALLEKDGAECESTSAELDELSRYVQNHYALPAYLPPVLVGYSSGATFAYANLVQAPQDRFGGAVVLGFCPELELRKPLCPGAGLQFSPSADHKGVDLHPASSLSRTMTVMQGEIDQVCPAEATQAFVAQVGNAGIVNLPKVGHGYSVTSRWQPQFLDAYRKIVEALKPATAEGAGHRGSGG